jgi:hypothetical protein
MYGDPAMLSSRGVGRRATVYCLKGPLAKKLVTIIIEFRIRTTLSHASSSSYPFPTLSEVGTTCFLSCCDKDSAIIFTTGRLPDVNSP